MSGYLEKAKKMLKFVKKNNLADIVEACLNSNEVLQRYEFKFSVRVEDDGSLRLIPNSKVKEWLDA